MKEKKYEKRVRFTLVNMAIFLFFNPKSYSQQHRQLNDASKLSN